MRLSWLAAQLPETMKWQDFGLVGLVLGAVAYLVWFILIWFQNALKEQRVDFLAALKGQQEVFAGSLKSLAEQHASELAKHEEQIKEWRKEHIEESRATRDMVQVFVGKLALITLGDREGEMSASKPRPGGKP